jgi:hypothetical protein
MLLTPEDPRRGNHRLLFDVPNRGNCLALATFNRVPRPINPSAPTDPGDGFLMRHGYTVVWCGWQHDVPAAEGLMRIKVPDAQRAGGPVSGRLLGRNPTGSVFNAVSHQDRVTLSAVSAVAMASWVTRCWSPASIAGVARPEPDVPEAPLVRAGRRLPVARPHLVRDLAGRALLLGEVGTRPEASPGHRQGRCRSPSPIPGPRRRFPCTRTAREPIPSRCATGRLIDRTVWPVAPHKRPASAVLASPPMIAQLRPPRRLNQPGRRQQA